ncbi:MAG: hypothetical protein KDB82_02440 [Planctomycetes bacterium]|nr:hypothetical protein [Planctomycetota bacterium]
MSLRAVVHPLFDRDVNAATAWYRERQAGLAERFERRLNACLSEIEERPESFQLARGQLRQARLHDFPYGVVFELVGDFLLIYGVFHTARDREVWDSRT